jgi:Family of unknown function (DUF6452)
LFTRADVYLCARMMKWFLFPVFAIGLIACFEQGDCSDVSSNVMQVNFYSNSTKAKLFIDLDSIKMVGWDTVMYEADSIATVTLPLNPAVPNMTYIFYYDDTQATLELKYKFQTFALAPDCNAIDIITLSDATGITIQDLTISQPKLTSSVVENIKLYF